MTAEKHPQTILPEPLPLTKQKPPSLTTRNPPRTILPESLGGSGATPAGALTRTHHQDKNSLDDSTRIARGLGGSCRVHKPGVPHGSTSQLRLSPAGNVVDNTQLMGRPKYLNDRPKGQSNHRPKGLVEEERCPFSTLAHLFDRSAHFGLQPTFRRPLRPEGLAKALLPTPTHVSNWGCTKPLFTALLQLAHSEPTGTNRPGMPVR